MAKKKKKKAAEAEEFVAAKKRKEMDKVKERERKLREQIISAASKKELLSSQQRYDLLNKYLQLPGYCPETVHRNCIKAGRRYDKRSGRSYYNGGLSVKCEGFDNEEAEQSTRKIARMLADEVHEQNLNSGKQVSAMICLEGCEIEEEDWIVESYIFHIPEALQKKEVNK